MSTGALNPAQHPWLEDERRSKRPLATQQQEQASRSTRTRIRKKSIRNAKDSAEMARIKYQRKWGHDAAVQAPQESHQPLSAAKVARHFGVGHGDNNRNVNLALSSREQDADAVAGASRASATVYPTRPPTPPRTSEAQGLPDFYWHDSLHKSAAALTLLPSGPGLVESNSTFDVPYHNLHRNSSDFNLPLQGVTSQDDQRSLLRLRSSSFDSMRSVQPKKRAQSPARPKTATGLDSSLLEVPIPHYRLGTPRFSDRGTAFLHNSFHTAFSSNIDLTLLQPSNDSIHKLFPAPPRTRHASFAPAPQSPTSWFSTLVTSAADDSRPAPTAVQPGERSNHSAEVRPSIYGRLAENIDSPAWVKLAPEKNEVIAATKARLIMEITSVKFLDYELLSDFFLTYRSFMTSAELARYLFARLRWAVSQSDSSGRIVRVRTFVALRHWVLNYFTDDFEPDFSLRSLFCKLVNSLALDLQQRPGGGGGDAQVLNELKKCWKRTCELVWGVEDHLEHDCLPRTDETASSDSGVSFQVMPSTAPLPAGLQEPEIIRPGGQSYFGSSFASRDPSSPPQSRRQTVPESPFSDTSIHVTSCSIPLRKRSRPNFRDDKRTLAKAHAHITHSSQKLQRRPSSRHQRSGSFSDALRDDRGPGVIPPEAEEEPITSQTLFRGGLIRGALIAPNVANVIIPGPLSPMASSVEETHRGVDPNSLLHPDSISNPAVMKLLGGVRRALSTRHNSKPSSGGGHKPSSSGDLRRLRASHSLLRPSTVDEQSHKREQSHSDALTALAARSWEEQPRDDARNHTDSESIANRIVPTSAQSELIPAKDRPLGPTRFNSHVTTGSRSILIFDDTGTTDSLSSQHLPPHSAPMVLSRTVSSSNGEVIGEAIRDMAMNNTAFLLPDRHFLLTRADMDRFINPTTESATTGAAALLGGPLSPPPSAPLPALPQFRLLPDISTTSGLTLPHLPHEPMERQSEAKGEPQDSPPVLATPLSQIGLALETTMPQHIPSRNKIGPTAGDLPPQDIVDDESNPPRLLRRRPGGNLRAVDTVHDLGLTHRRQSTGSLSSPGFSSPTSSIISPDFGSTSIASMWFNSELRGRSTDGQLRESRRRSSLRLLSTHSSQPNLRPSFEAEVRRLASLPADEEDGDIAATLMKLEGRFQPSRHSDNADYSFGNDNDLPTLHRCQANDALAVDDDMSAATSPRTETMGASIYSMSQTSHETVVQAPVGPSTPERQHEAAALSPEIDKEVKRWRRSSRVLWSPEPPRTSPDPEQAHSRAHSAVRTRDFADVVVSPKARFADDSIKNSDYDGSNGARSTFWLDDNESLLDTASIQAKDRPDVLGMQHDATRSFFFDEEEDHGDTQQGIDQQGVDLLHHSWNHHPPTPPITVGGSSDASSLAPSPSLLSPGPPPDTGSRERISTDDDHEKQINFTPRKQRKAPPARLHLPRHIPTHHTPFILAYSSSMLASQLTLIEKDALDCIDWKDLVNLSWSPSPPAVRDWAQYTHSLSSPTNDISSVDLIIARFNLVIKWCISSVLLCSTPQDRATCITKFIHIANYAHTKLHNFATTAQIGIGLLSSDLSRLSKTWALVPTPEKEILKKLESLVSPVRNFAALRAEMEFAAAALDEAEVGEDKGVIPFVGVYTRDLALNAQKPGLVPPAISGGTDDTEKLVNFERHRTAATIVKGVLRLLDASSRYTIRPNQEVLSRCLWLAALADGELSSLSKSLE